MSRVTRTEIAVALALAAAGAFAVAAAGYHAAFSGNVCSLLKASALEAVGVKPACRMVEARKGTPMSIYVAVWGGPGDLLDPHYNRLFVQVMRSPSLPGNLKAAAATPGVPVKIGILARAQFSGGGENLIFLKGHYWVGLNLKHHADSTAQNIGEIGAAMTAIGKTIAAEL